VFCLLSQYEGQAIAVLEALGVGTKALVSDISAHSELGRAGIVTTIGLDAPPERIATAVLAVAAAPPPPPRALPSWDVCVEQLQRLYQEVTA
jgi:glycosyltransferase involved in cell wall biosynthesis